MPTATTDKIVITYADLESAESGIDCRFIIIGKRGLKCYRCHNERDRHYRYQTDLADCNDAPDTYGCVDVELTDGSVLYAYWTEIAVCASEVYATDYSNPKRQTDTDDLMGRLESAGYDWNDDHVGNWGYVKRNGRDDHPVLIDCPGY